MESHDAGRDTERCWENNQNVLKGYFPPQKLNICTIFCCKLGKQMNIKIDFMQLLNIRAH